MEKIWEVLYNDDISENVKGIFDVSVSWVLNSLIGFIG